MAFFMVFAELGVRVISFSYLALSMSEVSVNFKDTLYKERHDRDWL